MPISFRKLIANGGGPPTGTPSDSTFLRGDNSWAIPAGGGTPGPEGPQGPQGATGATGSQGPQGVQGVKGDTGNTGTQGPAGNNGAQGIQGIQGPAGTNGTNGTNGQGVPTGGTTGQVLQKTSATDFATAWVTPAGGSDPWTYVRLTSDFTTSSATAVDVTGLNFTPAANTRYEFEFVLMLRTATATVGPRPGLAWPTGMTDGVAQLFVPTSATAQVMAFGNVNAALLAAVGGLPNTTQSWPARISGIVQAGPSPSGTVKAQLASETAATNVTAKANSFLRYRTY